MFLTENPKVKNWHCCPKGRTRKVHVFYILPLASAWGRTVDFWPPLEAGLPLSTFCFLFTRCYDPLPQI